MQVRAQWFLATSQGKPEDESVVAFGFAALISWRTSDQRSDVP